MDYLESIEELLDETARSCLRLIVTGTLTPAQTKTLSKWMYGCMNQRFTLRRRVRERGREELDKVLTFASEAWSVLQDIDNAPPPAKGSTEQNS